MTTEIKTEHPHVVRVPGVCGGDPIVAGTRISVVFIVRRLAAGDTPEEILQSFPHLSPAALYDAISYYHDHKDEIDGIIASNTPEELAARYGYRVAENGRIIFPDD